MSFMPWQEEPIARRRLPISENDAGFDRESRVVEIHTRGQTRKNGGDKEKEERARPE